MLDDARHGECGVAELDARADGDAELRQQHRLHPHRPWRRRVLDAPVRDAQLAEQRVGGIHGLQFHQPQPLAGRRHGGQLDHHRGGLEARRQVVRHWTQVALRRHAHGAAEQRRGAGVDARLHALRKPAHTRQRRNANGDRQQHGPQQRVRAAQLAPQQAGGRAQLSHGR